MSNNMKGEDNHFYGKSHSKEAINKMREKLKGRTHLEETKEKLSRLHKQREQTENQLDNLNYGKGENAGYNKLSKNEVVQIKKKLKDNINQSDLADEYNVSSPTISDIKNNRSWNHVEID
jgi:predicted nuclease with TOPRIM domain